MGNWSWMSDLKRKETKKPKKDIWPNSPETQNLVQERQEVFLTKTVLQIIFSKLSAVKDLGSDQDLIFWLLCYTYSPSMKGCFECWR